MNLELHSKLGRLGNFMCKVEIKWTARWRTDVNTERVNGSFSPASTYMLGMFLSADWSKWKKIFFF